MKEHNCEDAVVSRDNTFSLVDCGKKATLREFKDGTLIYLCEAHFAEWIKNGHKEA